MESDRRFRDADRRSYPRPPRGVPHAVASDDEARDGPPAPNVAAAAAGAFGWLARDAPSGRGLGPSRTAALLALQQTLGNRAVQRLVQRAAGDQAPTTETDLAGRIGGAGGGAPLPAAVQGRLEQGLGADLDGLRVHTDGEADSLARAVDAKAFTSGRDIFFRAGAYNPGSSSGMRMLAHEAAHALQQAEGPVSGTPIPGGVTLSDPSDSYERAADEAAARAVVAPAATPAAPRAAQRSLEGAAAGPVVQRWKDDGHVRCTTDAANDVFPDPAAAGFLSTVGIAKDDFVKQVAEASLNMDKIVPHLTDRFNPASSSGTTFWSFTTTLIGSGLKDLLPGNQRAGQTRRGIKGEGPDHGEAGYYDVPKADALPGNVARTNHYLDEAVTAFTSGDYRTMIDRLGDACHVAADRGSHAEGGQGEGHDTRMPDPDKGESGTNIAPPPDGYMENWADNDILALNPDGQQIGTDYTREALSSFLQRVTGTSTPTGAGDLAPQGDATTATV